MAKQDDSAAGMLPKEAMAGIDALTREVWEAIVRWDQLLATFWQDVHLDHAELETKPFSEALAEYTYAFDMAGYFLEEGNSPAALPHITTALEAIRKMLQADSDPSSGNSVGRET